MGTEFINVTVDTTGLYPVATRDYGTVAIVGNGAAGDDTPVKIGSYGEANTAFGDTDLGKAVKLALLNGAASVWAVDIGTPSLVDVVAGLESIEAEDIQVVALANIVETDADTYISTALANHCDAGATERIGVFMLDKAEDSTTMPTAIGGLLSAGKNRLFGIAHNSDNDVAAAVAGLIAGVKPWESPLVKGMEGVVQTAQFTTTQISALETEQINVLVNPVYLAGNAFVLGSTFTQGTAVSGIHYVDVRRVIDDISYKLKTGLTNPNIIGSLRINKGGLSELSGTLSGILGGCVNINEIDSFQIDIPVLNALAKNASARSEAETLLITTARTSRNIDVAVTVEYVGTFHTIDVDFKITA